MQGHSDLGFLMQVLNSTAMNKSFTHAKSDLKDPSN